MNRFFKKLKQKVVVFFMPSRVVYEISEEKKRKLLRTRSDKELSLQAQDLSDICSILSRLSIPYYLAGGTLLGIVRDGDLIPWDFDLDIDVRVEDIYAKQTQVIEALRKAGYEINKHSPSKINFKIKVGKHDASYEIVGFFKMGDMRYREWSCFPDSFMRDTSEVVLRGERYKTFAVPEQYLEWYYGGWRTPVKSSSHHDYVTKNSRTRPLALMRLRLAALFTKF